MGLHVELLGQRFQLTARKWVQRMSQIYERLLRKGPAVVPLFTRITVAAQRQKLLASRVFGIATLCRLDMRANVLHVTGGHEAAGMWRTAHTRAIAQRLVRRSFWGRSGGALVRHGPLRANRTGRMQVELSNLSCVLVTTASSTHKEDGQWHG